MLVECPHCHALVLPMQRNTCPSCLKDVSDTTGADLSLVSLVVHEPAIFPAFCFSCASPTTRYVEIVEEPVNRGDSPLLKAMLVFAAIVTLRGWILGLSTRRSSQRMIVGLPQCEDCAQSGKPKPERVDFRQREISFLVHRRFRDKVQELRQGGPR